MRTVRLIYMREEGDMRVGVIIWRGKPSWVPGREDWGLGTVICGLGLSQGRDVSGDQVG